MNWHKFKQQEKGNIHCGICGESRLNHKTKKQFNKAFGKFGEPEKIIAAGPVEERTTTKYRVYFVLEVGSIRNSFDGKVSPLYEGKDTLTFNPAEAIRYKTKNDACYAKPLKRCKFVRKFTEVETFE
jgi:hypothetical protein